jgi:hypothetical protein
MNFLAFLAVFYVFLKKAVANRFLALICVFMLASIRQFSNYAANGYADMPMAIYGSITFLGLYLWIKEKAPAYFWTAFFSAIFAMWAKNEGAVVLLGFITVLMIHIFSRNKAGGEVKVSYKGAVFAAGLLVALFISWSIFKASIHIHDDVVNSSTFTHINLLGLFKRSLAIFYEYQRQAFGVKYWNLAWIIFIGLAVYKASGSFSKENRFIMIPFFLILLCYTTVYFITPNDVTWQLRTTMSRLLIHILPLAVFYIALQTKRILLDVGEV